MKIVDEKSLQTQAQNFLKRISFEQLKKLLGLERLKINEMTLSLSKLVQLFIQYCYEKWSCAKHFWYVQKQLHASTGRLFVSYSVLMMWFARLDGILNLWMQKHKAKTTQSSLLFADSKKLLLGNGHHWVKVMGKNASIGHSSLGSFFGMKLHVVMNEQNQICSFGITPGSVHDLTYAKECLFKGLIGKMYADKGYVDKSFRFQLAQTQHLHLWVPPKSNQIYSSDEALRYALDWKYNHSKMYGKRQGIERLFAKLQRSFGLSIQGCKNVHMAHAKVYASMLAYTLTSQELVQFQTI